MAAAASDGVQLACANGPTCLRQITATCCEDHTEGATDSLREPGVRKHTRNEFQGTLSTGCHFDRDAGCTMASGHWSLSLRHGSGSVTLNHSTSLAVVSEVSGTHRIHYWGAAGQYRLPTCQMPSTSLFPTAPSGKSAPPNVPTYLNFDASSLRPRRAITSSASYHFCITTPNVSSFHRSK